MSRAFISESDNDFEEEDVPEIKNPLPPGTKNLMTPEGAMRLREQLRVLVNDKRPKAASLVAHLASPGGFNKDALARERTRLRQLDRRIEYISALMRNLEVVDPARQDREQVRFGAKVTVLEDGSKKSVYRIVGVEESDPSDGLLSWISPLARALIGSRVNDNIELSLPGGLRKLTILSIEYPDL